MPFDKLHKDQFDGKPVTVYLNQATMFADQANQREGYIYNDGTLDYVYLGTTNGDISDYRIIGGSITDNEVKMIYVNPLDLSGTGSLEQQICDYINSNVTIDYNKNYSKLNFAIGINPTIPFPSTITIGLGLFSEGYATWDGTSWVAIPWFQIPETIPNFHTDYQVYLAFGEPLATNVIPEGYAFGSNRLQSFLNFSDWYAVGDYPGDISNNALALASTTPPFSPSTAVWLPVRLRFIHTASGETSGYYYDVMQINFA